MRCHPCVPLRSLQDTLVHLDHWITAVCCRTSLSLPESRLRTGKCLVWGAGTPSQSTGAALGGGFQRVSWCGTLPVGQQLGAGSVCGQVLQQLLVPVELGRCSHCREQSHRGMLEKESNVSIRP